MGGSVGVVVVAVVGVVWAASLQAHPYRSQRWAFHSHVPTGFEKHPFGVESWPEGNHYHEKWDSPRWLQELRRSLEPRLGQVQAPPLTCRVHKRGRAPPGKRPGGGEGINEKEAIVTTADKRGIGLFSLAIALARKKTRTPEPMMHPADLSAYPRRARFFVATMG